MNSLEIDLIRSCKKALLKSKSEQRSNLWRFFLLFFNEVILRFWCLSKLQRSRVNVKSSILCSQRSRNKLIILKGGKQTVSSKFCTTVQRCRARLDRADVTMFLCHISDSMLRNVSGQSPMSKLEGVLDISDHHFHKGNQGPDQGITSSPFSAALSSS